MNNYRIKADIIHEVTGEGMTVEFVMDWYGNTGKPTEADVIESIVSDISVVVVDIIKKED